MVLWKHSSFVAQYSEPNFEYSNHLLTTAWLHSEQVVTVKV